MASFLQNRRNYLIITYYVDYSYLDKVPKQKQLLYVLNFNLNSNQHWIYIQNKIHEEVNYSEEDDENSKEDK